MTKSNEETRRFTDSVSFSSRGQFSQTSQSVDNPIQITISAEFFFSFSVLAEFF